MKKLLIGSVVLGLAVASQAVIIDDFSGDLSNWSSTVILDTDVGGGANTAAWQISSGVLQLDTTSYQSIEQGAFIYNGLSLAVGEEVRIDVSHTGASQDIGLYVGGTTPSFNVRQDYVAVYARGNGQLFSRGFDGGSEYGLSGGSSPAYTKLYIERTASNTFDAGYYDTNGVKQVIVTRTPGTANGATVVGLYTDVRASGTLGDVDNFEVIPEPATISLLGVFGAGVMLFRRRFGR